MARLTDNHDQIVRLFAPDALFYGTRSTELVTTPEGIRQYFEEALTGGREVRSRRLANPEAGAVHREP